MHLDEMPNFVVSEALDPQYRDDALALFKQAVEVMADDPGLIRVSGGYLYDRKGHATAGGFGTTPNKSYARPENDDIFMQVTVVVPHYFSQDFAVRARELDARIGSEKDAERREALENELHAAEAAAARIKAQLDQMNG